MNPEDLQGLVELLLKAGETMATQAFALAYERAIFRGVMNLLWGFLFLAPAYPLYRWLRETWPQRDEGRFFASAAIFLFVLVGLLILSVGVDQLLHPELWAIDNLLNIVQE